MSFNRQVLIAFFLILICLSCGPTPPRIRCFAASTPIDLVFINTGDQKKEVSIDFKLHTGEFDQDEFSIKPGKMRTVCYELENIPSGEVLLKIGSEEVKINLADYELKEIDVNRLDLL